MFNFFYVWMKRGLGDVFPELFSSELTDKDLEAWRTFPGSKVQVRVPVNGSARFEAKMLASLRNAPRAEGRRRSNIMFTPKKVEAWDTLSHALLDAGFIITASCPSHTESEHSLHQAKKNAAHRQSCSCAGKGPLKLEHPGGGHTAIVG
jgi:adenine-specific DNA methylase